MCRQLKWTPNRETLFLDQLEQDGGVTHACETCKISRQSAYVHRREDEEFAARWARAVKIGLEISLEDMEIAAKREARQNPTLRIFMIKGVARRLGYTHYDERQQIEHAGSIETKSEGDLDQFLGGLTDEQISALEAILENPTPGGDSAEPR
jgi:hypothetical protein